MGSAPQGGRSLPQALEAVDRIACEGKPIVVLSNSGKRASVNRRRIEELGFRKGSINHVVSSGEVAWRDLSSPDSRAGIATSGALLPICAAPGDARNWAEGSSAIKFADRLELAGNILLMGIPDDAEEDQFDSLFRKAARLGTGMICTNPDKVSLRGDRRNIAPGFLAQKFADMGGRVAWYGKPYPKVFDAVRNLYPEIPRDRFLMIGDSMEHDIEGAKRAEFLSMLVFSGIHDSLMAASKSDSELQLGIEALASEHATEMPDFCIEKLR